MCMATLFATVVQHICVSRVLALVVSQLSDLTLFQNLIEDGLKTIAGTIREAGGKQARGKGARRSIPEFQNTRTCMFSNASYSCLHSTFNKRLSADVKNDGIIIIGEGFIDFSHVNGNRMRDDVFHSTGD